MIYLAIGPWQIIIIVMIFVLPIFIIQAVIRKNRNNSDTDKNNQQTGNNAGYKFCSNCGKKIKFEAKFCEHCGAGV
jgi:membrane protease subunit (stomatin/prohibitin family)